MFQPQGGTLTRLEMSNWEVSHVLRFTELGLLLSRAIVLLGVSRRCFSYCCRCRSLWLRHLVEGKAEKYVLHRIFLEPLLHAPGDIGHIGEAVLEHPGPGSGAAHSGGTMDKVFGVLGEIYS